MSDDVTPTEFINGLNVFQIIQLYLGTGFRARFTWKNLLPLTLKSERFGEWELNLWDSVPTYEWFEDDCKRAGVS